MAMQWYIFFLVVGIVLFPRENLAQEKIVQDPVVQDDLGEVEDKFQEYFFEALKQKAIENPKKAIIALKKCLKIDKKPVVYFELGKNYNSLKMYKEAESALLQAQKGSQNNKAILTELYQTYLLSKQYKKALPIVKMLKLSGDNYAKDLVHLYMVTQKYDKALILLDSLDGALGTSTYRDGLRSQIYGETNNFSAKIAHLKKDISNNPNNEKSYLDLIFVYSEAGFQQKALKTSKKLLEIKPKSPLAHLAVYKFHLDNNKLAKAKASIKIVLASNDIGAKTKEGVLNDFFAFLNEHPNEDLNIADFVDFISQKTSMPTIKVQFANYFLEKGNKQKALTYFESALNKDKSNFSLIKKTLLLQLEFKKYEKAKKLSGEALQNFPSQPILYLFRGRALIALRFFEKARDVLGTGLDFLIENPEMEMEFYEQLSKTYLGLNNQEKAEAYQEKIEEIKNTKLHEL